MRRFSDWVLNGLLAALSLAVACLLSLMVAAAVSAFRDDKPASTTAGVGAALKTVDHDEHRFVVLETFRGAALIHHPECPCGKP